MAKIKQYANDNNISVNDKLIGTDADDNDKTKNFKIGKLIEFLVSMGVGTTGPQGPIGETGPAGEDGKSAYEVAVENGFTGTVSEWLNSLIGPPGESVPYKEYAVRLSQSGTSSPSVPKTFVDQLSSIDLSLADPLFFDISFSYVGVGLYKMRITKNLTNPLNAFNCDLSFSDNKIRATGYSSGSTGSFSYVDFNFETRNFTGELANGIISFTNLYFKIWEEN